MAAASLNHDVSTFDTCRVTANAALLSHWAEELHNTSAAQPRCSSKKHRVDTDLLALLNWLSILDRHADVQSPLDGQAYVYLAGNLKAVASARESYLRCYGTIYEEDKRFAAYVQAKAWFVTKACLRLGASVLIRNKDCVKVIMQQEAACSYVRTKFCT